MDHLEGEEYAVASPVFIEQLTLSNTDLRGMRVLPRGGASLGHVRVLFTVCLILRLRSLLGFVLRVAALLLLRRLLSAPQRLWHALTTTCSTS